MTESGSDAPRADGTRVGFTALAVLGLAALLIVAGGVTGVWMGARGSHPMMWGGGPAPGRLRRAGIVARRVERRAGGFTLAGMPADMVDHYSYARPARTSTRRSRALRLPGDARAPASNCFVTPDGAWDRTRPGARCASTSPGW
jgi:hypothetical protein